MGVRVKFVAVACIAILVAVLIFYFVNIAIFCENNKQLDFKYFKIDCGTVPNKKVQLDDALNQGCQMLKANFSCEFRSVNDVTVNYEEWGKPARNYTLFELCSLKNYYYNEQSCARYCGCIIV
jgi:hypothetical protein